MTGDLFEHAGVVLERANSEAQGLPRKGARRRKPTASERAALERQRGARRGRATTCPCNRSRVGPARNLLASTVLAFPLARNRALVEKIAAGLPDCYDPKFEQTCRQRWKYWETKLIRMGTPPEEAYKSAYDLIDAVADLRIDISRRRFSN